MSHANLSNKALIAWAQTKFGVHFARLASLSPTMMSDLRGIKRAGVRVRVVSGMDLAYCSGRTLYIGTRGGDLHRLLSLAHEKFHVINQRVTQRCPDPLKLTLKGYVRQRMNCEVDAELHALKILVELKARGVTLKTFMRGRWLKVLKRHGRQGFYKKLASAISTSGETFAGACERKWKEANGKPVQRPKNRFFKRFSY